MGIVVNESSNPKISLKIISAPSVGPVVSAPPVLIASTHTVDYTCGSCGIVLLHAEDEQIHNLQIQCTKCGAYNTTGQ
jgi:ribosomal protein S27AE